MGKSKIFAICLISILTGCGAVSNEVLFEQTTISFGLYAEFDEGVIYTENGNDNLMYLDYESGKFMEFCAVPSCTHNNESCGAYRGDVLSFFVAGDKFYYFSYATEHRDSGEYIDLYESDMNRQNEKLIASFSGVLLNEKIYSSNAVYILVQENIGEEEGLLSYNKGEIKLIGYDLIKNEIIGEAVIVSGYSQSIIANYGIYDDKIIFKTHRFSEAVEWGGISEDELDKLMSDVIVEYVCVEINALQTTTNEDFSKLIDIEVEIENPIFLSNDVVFYNLDGKLYTYNIPTEETSVILDNEVSIVVAVEDKVLMYEKEDRTNMHLYENEELRQIYMPQNGDMMISPTLWHSHLDYIYISSASANGSIGKYEQGSPFIIKVKSEDIYKENYEAEIVSG